jgi:phosphoribosylaminoimidazole-succinocarboxamide synthase
MLSSEEILARRDYALSGVELDGFGAAGHGKVRDFYELPGDRRLLVTTDRQSAFDYVLGEIPFKGQVLNELSAFWFGQTANIVPNHLLEIPDPNVALVKKAKMFPVEVIVRGYLTGVTDTSIWVMYQNGQREMYGLQFADGLRKNQVLPSPIITPTTHAEVGGHDKPLSGREIVENGIIAAETWAEIERAALALFRRGQEICRAAGLILVDTKYEFGVIDGKVAIVDEVHTPDSSRFWLADSYAERFGNGQEPENFDKEFLRLWLREQGYGGNGAPPPLSDEIVAKLSQRYQACYERITGKTFTVDFSQLPQERIRRNVAKYLS